MSEKKLKPAYPELYNTVLEEFKTTEGMTYAEVKQGIDSAYVDKVKRYIGEEKPPYNDNADAEAISDFFSRKWENPYNKVIK